MLTPVALVLIAAGSLSWSVYDLTRKLLVDRMSPTPLLLLLTAGQAPLLLAWAAVDGLAAPRAGYLAPAAASVVLNLIANLAFIHAFKVAPISVTIPLLSLTPVFTTVFAVPLLGELPSPVQWVGILLVVGGAILINLRRGPQDADGPGSEPSSGGALRRLLRHQRGLLLMVVVAVCWSLASPFDKLAMEAATPPFHGFVLCAGVAAGVFVILAWQRRVGEARQIARAPGVFVLALVLSGFALAFQLLAIRIVWVSLVETLKRGFGNVAALAYGRFLFGEPLTAAKVAGVAMITAGVGLTLS